MRRCTKRRMTTSPSERKVPTRVFPVGSMQAVVWQDKVGAQQTHLSAPRRISLHRVGQTEALHAESLMRLDEVSQAIEALRRAKKYARRSEGKPGLAAELFVTASELSSSEATW